MASILRFDNWQNSDGTSIATTDASGNISFAGVGAGKILQVVRTTDTSNHAISATSYVDVSGMSVTITPTSTTSTILVVASFVAQVGDPSNSYGGIFFRLADSTGTALSGGEDSAITVTRVGGATDTTSVRTQITMIAYHAPATTSATTYKLQSRESSSTFADILNSTSSTGQMYAIEVAA